MKVKVVCCNPIYLKFPILSWLIKFFQEDYSHFAIEFGGFVLDATGKDVRLYNAETYFTHRYEKVREYEIDIDADFLEVLAWSKPLLNRKYGYFQIIGLLFIILGLTNKNPFGKDYNNLICNEIVLLFLEDFKGLEIEDSDDYDLVSTELILREYSC